MQKGLALLYIGFHPIQNTKPYRLMQNRSEVKLSVLYLEDPDQTIFKGNENITKEAFDHNTVSGYPNYFIKNNIDLFNKLHPFFAHFSFEPFQYVKKNDVVIIYGHSVLSFWIAMFTAKWYRKKLILTTDATYIEANA